MFITDTWLFASTTIPKQHFDAYQQSFALVKVSTENMLLRARAHTEAMNGFFVAMNTDLKQGKWHSSLFNAGSSIDKQS